ncbi:MAG TPA: hypothetical protein VGP93_00415 [Polyangiaceae bacterium]|nr:hypothetical protein [Polyangiaceae bacterium]
MKLHAETLLAGQSSVLAASAAVTQKWQAYLAGGMAAALQLGHRVSADFDWFTKNTLQPADLLADVNSLGFPVQVRQNDEGTFLGQVGGIEFSVFRYRYELVRPTVAYQGCALASLSDIGAMKLAVICQRAQKRDYVDLHAIITVGRIPLADLVLAWQKKYPGKDAQVSLKAATYFDDVDGDRMPEMLNNTIWTDVKKNLKQAVQRYLSRR